MPYRKFLVVVGDGDIAGDLQFNDKEIKFAGLAYVLKNGVRLVVVDSDFDIKIGEIYVG